MDILLEKVNGQGWDAAADEGTPRNPKGTPRPLGRDISGAIFPRKGMPQNF
jgi:hypothetical protein